MPLWHEVKEGLYMRKNTMKDFSILLKYLPVYKRIGSSCISKAELKKTLKEFMPEIIDEEEFFKIEPFLIENEEHLLQMDMCLLRDDLADFLEEFLPGLLSEEIIAEIVLENMQGKVLLEISEDITAVINEFLMKDIVVQKVRAVDASGNVIICANDGKEKKEPELSDTPAIYSGKRPSWFTPLREEMELSKKNIAKKNAEHTNVIFFEKLQLWNDLKNKKISAGKKAEYVDETRKRNIEKLLLSNDTNEEKYIKYMLLTPGIDREYMKTLNGAAELGLNADVVIGLLEQPAGSFNREIFEAYVSQVHKATEYNLKQELAEELIRGEWYVVSEINGSEQKFQLVPMEKITEVENKLRHICSVFEKFQKISSDTSCHNGTKLNEMENKSLKEV